MSLQMHLIPEHMMAAIRRYIDHHIQPGGFLTAVLENDLHEAVARADDTNIRLIPEYVAYFYNHAPCGCWGSRENVRKWLAYRADYYEPSEMAPMDHAGESTAEERDRA